MSGARLVTLEQRAYYTRLTARSHHLCCDERKRKHAFLSVHLTNPTQERSLDTYHTNTNTTNTIAVTPCGGKERGVSQQKTISPDLCFLLSLSLSLSFYYYLFFISLSFSLLSPQSQVLLNFLEYGCRTVRINHRTTDWQLEQPIAVGSRHHVDMHVEDRLARHRSIVHHHIHTLGPSGRLQQGG